MIRGGDVDGVSEVAPGAPDKLLTVVREKRAGASGVNDLNVSNHGSTAAVSFSTALTWKNPFGANRRGTMRVSGTLVRDGRSWRLTRASITELPDVK
jgi:hypothetical protein